ncbi:MAG TPA: glycosyltransferase [Pseudonocardia sp.]|uniref:glycosyltransferase n=1 Tax=Pseudonocardia sp. TaxID=60912 RepID=UPI002B9D7012|nr:glycosyltransferase [Pseudonocardia sp.]HTF54122.1 glycosyltransferase [Pseudonocardia sp.]
MRVLINAGPWLPVPPDGYGGIENVVATLVPELRRRGVYVVLATVGKSALAVDELVCAFQEPRFGLLQRPYNQVMGAAMAHADRVVRELRGRNDLDLVHDHLEAVGPTVLGAMDGSAPPVLHTLHWDLTKHAELYGAFDGRGRVFVNGVSASQLAMAPLALRAHSLGHVHLATPLAEGADRPDSANRAGGAERAEGDYLVSLGRITPAKGQHIAAKVAHRAGVDLLLAGPVGPYHRPAALAGALATDPDAASNPDVRYWCEQVQPLVDGRRVRWVGGVDAARRDEIVAGAAASLIPLQWEEPGGTAVVESLSLGAPVVGYRRGCLPELVDEASTGFLVDPGDEDALVRRVGAVATLSRMACRRAAAARFSPALMAERYLALYAAVLQRAARNGSLRRRATPRGR